MKRLITVLLLCALTLSGCGWMDGYHVSVTPHLQHSGSAGQQVVTAENFLQLCTALEDMVSDGVTSSVISVANFETDQLQSSVDTALRYIKNIYPMGAYTVEDISCEIGTSGGVAALAVEVTYRHGREDLQKIRHVKNMEEAGALIGKTLASHDASLVLLVDAYEPVDIQQLVDSYAQANPSQVMQIPSVSEQIFPYTGRQRVWELKFSYQTNRDSLRTMKEQVTRIFDSAALYVSHDAQDSQKFSQLYAFLMERFGEYQIKTSITPAYSLLSYGVGDSYAFSTVFSEMCRRAGMECMVVEGTRDGAPVYWNMICDNGYYYHVDLLVCMEAGGYRKQTDEEMLSYVWDYSAYPECVGEPEPTIPETTEPPYQPEETTEPATVPTEETLPPETENLP